MLQHPVQHLWVPGAVPSLNELFEARGRSGLNRRGRYYDGYNGIKQLWTERVVVVARTQRLTPVDEAWLTYLFFEESQRRDPSNFAGSGMKLIEDGLRKAGILPNDGWRHVLGFALYWVVDKKTPGTAVFLSKHAVLDKATALWRDQQERVINGQV